MDRALAACALGAVMREACEDVAVYATAGSDSERTHATRHVPARRGMALIDAIYAMCHPLGGGGIFLNQVCNYLREQERQPCDRMVVITDEQDCADSHADSPANARPIGTRNYMINVSTYRNGIGYDDKWVHINGWSEKVVDYIMAAETAAIIQ